MEARCGELRRQSVSAMSEISFPNLRDHQWRLEDLLSDVR